MKEKHIRQSKEQEQSPQPGMCWGHRGNSQGDQYGWSTTGEGDSGRKVGWEGSQQPGRMVLVGHFKNFKVHSEVNGK